LFTQAIVDLALVTVIVHLGGDTRTALAALFVVVIAANALLLPILAGLTVTVLGCGVYLGDTILSSQGVLPSGLTGQIVVFAFVFQVVATLGRRLRETAARQDRLESELRQARFEASEILRSIRAGVLTVDGQGCLAFVNPPAEQLLGLRGDRDLGSPVLELLAARAPELHQAIEIGLRDGRRVGRGEGQVTLADGRSFPIGLSTATFEREGGNLPAVTAVFTDLSELKQLQELHLRTERLEAVAALSASLAHEISNPLASIRSSVEQLSAFKTEDEDEHTLVQLILRESDRLSRILGEFLDFSRVRAGKVARVDLLAITSDAVALVREHPDCGAGIVIEQHGEQTELDADQDLLHRIVSNLLLNAVQACAGNGRIRIDVGVASDGGGLPSASPMEQHARLVVSDDGPGIPPEVQDRLFQPFVSGRAGGSGLGLAIVHRAVEAHGGMVFVDSEPGHGSTFTVLLPSRAY
ncbi:MAG: PAS domain S-box protein, partial [Gemmatimonadales bacterium]